MPNWVESGYQEYIKRLPPEFNLQLIEIDAKKRGKGIDIGRIMHQEGEQILAHIQPSHTVIALAIAGQSWDTPTLANQLQKWTLQSKTLSLLIGGPEGLAPACLARANCRWSLSALTLPHPLVRVLIAEQLYRAWSILARHPYHK